MASCRYPEHHNSSGGVAGWLAALVIGAVILAEWHVVVVALVVVAILAVAGLIVLLSWRAHRTLPYDAAWQDDLPAAAPAVQPVMCAAGAGRQLQARLAAVEAQLAARQLEYGYQAELAGPAEVHQHVHLHGLTDQQVAELAGHAVTTRRAIGQGQHDTYRPTTSPQVNQHHE